MTRYRFLDEMGDVLAEVELDDHAAALEHGADEEAFEVPVNRVEFLGEQGEWRWAGPLMG